MILGVDVSTSITGFAIVADNQLLYYDSIDLRKFKNVFDKSIAIKEKILDLYEMYQLNNDDSPTWGDSDYPIQHIYVEQPFTFFNSGGSSAKTMATLQKFNGIVSWILYEIFEIKPEFTNGTEYSAGQSFVQFNSNNPADGAEAYTFRGNFTYLRVRMDRAHVGDGSTYDASYGSISKVILSA